MLFEVLILLAASWITSSTPISGNLKDNTVPEITSCAYVNAYYVTCWWKRSKYDTTSTYRLGYTSAADAIHARREKYCDKTEQSIDGDVIIESCDIRGFMYGRFTLWVASVHDCDITTGSCESVARSADVEFTCTRKNVKLTIPPSSLTIDAAGHRLSWNTPDKELSMLSFVLRRRNVLYKVEYRELIEDKETSWEELPTTYETSVFLPTLVPGVSYEFRVLAALDSPETGYHPSSERAASDVEKEWTVPSNILVFMTPRTMKITEEDSAFKSVEKIYPDEQTTSSEIDVIKPAQVSQRIIVLASVMSFIVVVVVAILGYFLPWKRWCCANSTKFIKPSVFVDFKEILNENETPSRKLSPSKNIKEEKICPITQLIEDESEIIVVEAGKRHNRDRYSVLSRSGRSNSNIGRQQLLSPSQNLDDSLSLNELLDLVPDQSKDVESNITIGDDITDIRHNDVPSSSNSWETSTKQRKFEPKKYWRGSRYLKLDKDEEIPSYLMASMKSLDRTMSDYVTDDTGIGSTFLNDSSDVTDMMSSGDEEKEKQWQKYLFESVKEEDGDSDDIPDYVMHAPSFNKDFCKNMTTFLSMATSDVIQREPTEVVDFTVTEEQTSPKNDVTQICSLMGDEKALFHVNENSRFNNDGTSQFVIMTMCSSCKNCQKHVKCQTDTTTEQHDNRLHRQRSFHHRGSVSDHSIDSGYSPDSSERVILMSKDNLLGSNYEIRGSQASSDNESDDEYMTYIATS